MQQVQKLFCLLGKGNDLDYLSLFSLIWSNATPVACFLRYSCALMERANKCYSTCFLNILILEMYCLI